MKRVLELILFLFLLVSCNTKLQPGVLYEVYTSEDSGFLLLGVIGEERDRGTYYVDVGNLYAKSVPVRVTGTSRNLKMVYPDGSRHRFTCQPYKCPAFINLPSVNLYKEPLYDFSVENNQYYGSGRGFWDSYEVPYGENFLITYGRKAFSIISSMGDVGLYMDIYHPVGDGKKSRPLFLMIHGGAFFTGDKEEEEYSKWCKYFASLGYVAASINYRLGFRPTPNEVQRAGYRAVQDANAAVRYLINRKDLRVDANRVFVSGTSAGAITALNLAFMTEKDRPEITWGGTLGDEGPIDAISPQCKEDFSIRAVGNMWGALQDLRMLKNSKAAVISFHSEDDPIVPYRQGYPFQSMFGDLAFNSLFFEMMYGSYEIDRYLRQLGRHTELNSYKGNKHSVHLDDDGYLNTRFDEIKEKLAAFFLSEMEPFPVNMHQDKNNPQTFHFDSTDVNRSYWKVEGGVIRTVSLNEVSVLLFPDVSRHTLTLHGDYLSGITYTESLSL